MTLTRRSLMQALAGVAAAAVAAVCRHDVAPYGYLDVKAHRRLSHRGVHLHVWYQGEDVTRHCAECSDTGHGWARLFLKNSEGLRYIDHARGRVADEMVYGITLQEGAPFA